MGRLLAGFLSFLVSIQLSVGQHTLVLVNTAQAQTCAAGQKLDPIMGRCLSTEQASQVASATAGCASAGDETAQKKCYLHAAEASLASAEASGDVKGAGKVNTDMLGMILTLGGLVSSVMFLTTGASAGCGPFTASAAIIAASSMAAFMGEVLASNTYKKKMKEANESLKKINDGSAGATKSGVKSDVMSATNVQEEAFNALIKKEEAVIAAANTKKKLYTLAMLGYAAATVMAGIEVGKMILPGGAVATACKAASHSIKPDEGTLISSYVDNYFLRGQRVPFSSYLSEGSIASAETITTVLATVAERNHLLAGNATSPDTSAIQIAAVSYEDVDRDLELLQFVKAGFRFAQSMLISPAQAQIGEGAFAKSGIGASGGSVSTIAGSTTPQVTGVAAALRTLYTSPVPRLALSAILTANAVLTKAKAAKEAGKAKDRKAFLEKLRDQVTMAGSGLNCGSADVGQASANCKSKASDTINPNGATSGTGLTGAEFTTDSNNELTIAASSCVTNTGTFDSSCACKNNNTCLKIGSSISGSIPAGINLGSVASSLDAVNGGSLTGGRLNEADLTAQAARLNNLNQNLAKRNPAVAKASSEAKAKAEEMSAAITKTAQTGAQIASSATPDSGLTNTTTPEQALEALKTEFSQEINRVEGQAASSDGTKSELDLTGLEDTPTETQSDVPNDKLAENMASEFDMGNNDINTETSTSIFDIVSNRYKRSGIRRLLGSEQLIPADGAASSDINR